MRWLRASTAFLLALHAVSHASLRYFGGVSAWPLLLVAVAALLGQVGPGPAREPPQRDRAGTYRVGSLWSLYALLVGALFLASSLVEGEMAQLVIGSVVLFELLFLAWPSIGPRGVPLLVNSLVLCTVASLAGGPLAVSAVAGFAPLAAAFVVADQHELHRASPWTCAGPLLGHVLLAITVTAPLLASLPAEPVLGAAMGERAAPTSEELLSAWIEVAAWAGVGLLLLWLARRLLDRFLGRDGDEEPGELMHEAPPEEAVPWAPLERLDEIDFSGARGRILRAHDRYLRRCERLGLARKPSTTALEFSGRLPAPARRLARLFGRARYSDEELGDREALEAEAAVAEVLRNLKAR